MWDEMWVSDAPLRHGEQAADRRTRPRAAHRLLHGMLGCAGSQGHEAAVVGLATRGEAVDAAGHRGVQGRQGSGGQQCQCQYGYSSVRCGMQA